MTAWARACFEEEALASLLYLPGIVPVFTLPGIECSKVLWNCIGLPEGFLLRVVVSYFLVLGCRFAYFCLYLGFWTELVT